ncbi:hypothetical protein VNI00_017658 [Paramarasmius palmivorus]|uniref:MYND-type domain-containing protein n=1 Tax=Paramarasmius palmivorus TaxID=297713 RepID=A0AAW0B7H6_9AGAR
MVQHLTLQRLRLMARTSDPKTLRHIRDMLDIPVPGDGDPECVIASRCGDALNALELFALYLLPCYYGRHNQLTVFPGMNEAETWVLLWKWFLLLEGWSPSFGGVKAAPASMHTVEWYNRVIRSIFDIIFVLAHHHATCRLTRMIAKNEALIRFSARVLYGAMSVEDTTLYPIVTVTMHSFWDDKSYDAAGVPELVRSIVQDNPSIDFVSVAVKRFVGLVSPPRILSRIPEVHAVAVAIVQLYPIQRSKVFLSRVSRWFTICFSSVMKDLRRVTRDGRTVTLDLDTELVGKVAIFGSSGWVLDALNAGLLKAMAGVQLFLKVELLRSRLAPVWTHRQDLITEGGALLESLVPHLMTPSVLRVVRRLIEHMDCSSLSVFSKWKWWTDAVAAVYEMRSAYKRSPYRKTAIKRCAYPMCPNQDNSRVSFKVVESDAGDVPVLPVFNLRSMPGWDLSSLQKSGGAIKESPLDVSQDCSADLGDNGLEDDSVDNVSVTPSRVCKGCLQTCYCSSSCQALDWDTRHRDRCNKIRRERKDGIQNNLYCNKGFIRFYVQHMLNRRESDLIDLRSQMTDDQYVVVDFGDALDVLRLAEKAQLPEDVMRFRPQTPLQCSKEDVIVVLCEKQSLVLWMWHGVSDSSDDSDSGDGSDSDSSDSGDDFEELAGKEEE